MMIAATRSSRSATPAQYAADSLRRFGSPPLRWHLEPLLREGPRLPHSLLAAARPAMMEMILG